MLSKEEMNQFEELKSKKQKKKISHIELAKLRALENKMNKEVRSRKNTRSLSSNVYSSLSTAKVTSYSIRFLEPELIAIENRIEQIKNEHGDLIVRELGSLNDVNKTKLIRAALYLLNNHSDEEVIKAIKQVRTHILCTS